MTKARTIQYCPCQFCLKKMDERGNLLTLHSEKYNHKINQKWQRKALLMILDGWGIGNHSKGDVIFNTPTPYWDYLVNTYPHSQLQASGECRSARRADGQLGGRPS